MRMYCSARRDFVFVSAVGFGCRRVAGEIETYARFEPPARRSKTHCLSHHGRTDDSRSVAITFLGPLRPSVRVAYRQITVASRVSCNTVRSVRPCIARVRPPCSNFEPRTNGVSPAAASPTRVPDRSRPARRGRRLPIRRWLQSFISRKSSCDSFTLMCPWPVRRVWRLATRFSVWCSSCRR
jgi:hypothetical protein